MYHIVTSERRTMRMLCIILLSEILLVTAGCPSWPFLAGRLTDIAEVAPPVADALQRINATLYAVLDPVSLPGFNFAVAYKGKVLAAWGGGVADKATGRTPDPYGDVHRIASNTKLFVSLLAELFAEMGLIRSLDDPVRTYAPDFPGPINVFNDSAEVTFRHLMSHTSGLPDSLPGNGDWQNMTTAAVWDVMGRVPAGVPFGSGVPLYSNLGIATLGHVLAEYVAPANERGSLGPILSKYVLQPLGLAESTGYDITAEAAQRLIPGYDANGDRVPIEYLGWAAPCGTMWSSVANLALFHQATATVASGTPITNFFLAPSRARSWLEPVSLLPDNSITMGQPWETFVTADGVIVRSKSGTLSGYATKSALIPELRLSFAFSYNGNFQDWYTGNALLLNISEVLVPAITTAITSTLPPRSPGPSPMDYVGNYTQSANSANTATVTYDAVTRQLVITSSIVVSGASTAVMQWAGPRSPDSFLLFGDPTTSTCEHVVFGDVTWAVPVVFVRGNGARGNVTSASFINWDGDWPKVG